MTGWRHGRDDQRDSPTSRARPGCCCCWPCRCSPGPITAGSSLGRPHLQPPAGRGGPDARRGAWRLHLPFYARLLAFACLALALARPQLGYAWEESLTEGIDIQLVLDISGSMGAEDFQPKDRLTVAKQVVQGVRRRPAGGPHRHDRLLRRRA